MVRSRARKRKAHAEAHAEARAACVKDERVPFAHVWERQPARIRTVQDCIDLNTFLFASTSDGDRRLMTPHGESGPWSSALLRLAPSALVDRVAPRVSPEPTKEIPFDAEPPPPRCQTCGRALPRRRCVRCGSTWCCTMCALLNVRFHWHACWHKL
jgi:hypothetical protein